MVNIQSLEDYIDDLVIIISNQILTPTDEESFALFVPQDIYQHNDPEEIEDCVAWLSDLLAESGIQRKYDFTYDSDIHEIRVSRISDTPPRPLSRRSSSF
jgi:hypothetical protein